MLHPLCRTKERTYPEELRSITVPIISLEKCRRIYRFNKLTERHICILDDVEWKHCGDGDSGGPLVIGGHLAGVYAWKRGCYGPDIFMNLAHPENRNWILENMNIILHSQNIQHYPHNPQALPHPHSSQNPHIPE